MRVFFKLLMLLLWLTGMACADPYRVQVEMSPSPPVVGTGHIIVHAAHGLTADVRASMPDMPGMGAVAFPLAETQPGRYEGNVTFSMAGAWRLEVHVRGPAGEATSAVPCMVGGQSVASPSPTLAPGALTVGLAGPARVGHNVVIVNVLDAGGHPRDDVQVGVGLTMPGMSMHVRPQVAEHRGPGRYQTSVYLGMAGVWNLTAEVREASGPVGVKTVPVTVSAPVDTTARWATGALLAMLVALVGVGVWQRPRQSWVIGSLACLLVAAAAGEAIRARWPADTSMGMPMDMQAPDMGLSPGVFGAPVPVALETVARHPLLASVSAAGTAVGPRLDPITIRAQVAREDGVQLKLGTLAALLSPVSQRNDYAQGHLTAVGHAVDAQTQTLSVEARFPNPKREILPGQDVTLTLLLAHTDAALAVPIRAVSQFYGDPSVWMVGDVAGQQVAHRRSVVVGLQGTDRIEIVSGLADGDRVVVAGGESLLEDAVVVEAEPGTGAWQNLLLPPRADGL